MSVNSNFHSGNIELIEASDFNNIRLRIPKDTNSEFFQWFHFALQGCQDQQSRLVFENADEAAYVDGWDNYQAVASYDRKNWFRVPTTYTNGQLVVSFTPTHNNVYIAYFTPYSEERHLDLIASTAIDPRVQQHNLGTTAQGRDISLLKIGSLEANALKIWITARQHPGETMAEWFIEGLLERLLDNAQPIGRQLLASCCFYVVPNMNPDGSALGNLRVNSKGINLNREWLDPSIESSPEVLHVRKLMLDSGVDMYFDVHGDEALPVNFVDGCQGVPKFTDQMAQLEQRFKNAYLKASPDFQIEKGYAPSQFGEANLTVATKWVGNEFGCLAFTIEMPFKDNENLPDEQVGWSAERSKILGADLLTPIYEALQKKFDM
ncbi:M14 family metallopeptidase [Alginatibacterium sediminis]|uniref:M14 family metallopeptidase n=1 Tax=Alginatibacterium sediminis TaxID=2164068 RepID=UPI0018F6EA18|nr:M14-type cytosolic carboxypeptidase [Alginatibacterium sediminis]